MSPAQNHRRLRIGVDVGGTNTDGVIFDPLEKNLENAIKAWHKTPTTDDPGHGIEKAITSMLRSGIDASQIASVTIGTTHFVNAIVEMDTSRLSRVAVLRLCGPFTKHVEPFADWDSSLRDAVSGYCALLKGGLEVDGNLISDIDEDEIRDQCEAIRDAQVQAVVITGVFSPIDTVEKQEERVASIIRKELPGCDVVCSRDVAGLGFLERENAAILNAVILRFAKRTIRSFRQSLKRLGMNCPLFVTQNDGTAILDTAASQLPIRTFSSGPTNSIRGAAFLSHGPLEQDVMVVDIGGTTTDVGLLQKNGFPRQQAAYSDLCGVRLNFSCPDIKSIGLGGGSIVRQEDSALTIGPDSVGYKLTEEAVSFGGGTLTATDLSLLVNLALDLGDRSLLAGKATESQITAFQALVRQKLERIIDTMKTSPEDLPVILVGGGAIVAPNSLGGTSKVFKPALAHVANAIGAATARISVVEDTIMSTEETPARELLEQVKASALEKTAAAGAKSSSIEIVEVQTLPLPVRFAHSSQELRKLTGSFAVYFQQDSFRRQSCWRV
jgi:N-methylhydantoinase A/oxoprolinase/acetone carboxylase beta subunit